MAHPGAAPPAEPQPGAAKRPRGPQRPGARDAQGAPAQQAPAGCGPNPVPKPETPMAAALMAAGEAAVGARVAVWWPEDRVFYKVGPVERFATTSRLSLAFASPSVHIAAKTKCQL